RRRRSCRDVDDAALLVERHLAPVVRAADVVPSIWRIRVVTELSWMGNGVELPQQLAGDDVVRADVSRRRHDGLARLTAENHRRLPDAPWARRLRAHAGALRAEQSFPHVDSAVNA